MPDRTKLFERIKAIRKYRSLSQEEVGSWFDITKQSYGKNETGENDGFGLEEIAIFLEKTKMASSYLFGETDSLEGADLTRDKPAPLNEEVEELRKLIMTKLPDSEKKDPLQMALFDQDVRDIVQCMKPLSRELKRMILSYCRGLHDLDDLYKEKKRDVV